MSIKYRALQALQALRPFLGAHQRLFIADAMRGAEKEYFFEKTIELAGVVEAMPKTYDTNGQGDNAIVHLHYFTGGCDWYIVERDMEPEQLQAFGLADLGYGGEMGYINIEEITRHGAELDFHWTPKTLGEIRRAPVAA